jgi:hypothetical protein
VGYISILTLVTAGTLFVAARSEQWGLLLGLAVAWLAFLCLLLIALRYQISWSDESISQQASGGKSVNISYADIKEVRFESASATEWAAMARPFRRITIYGHGVGGRRHIDISVRHFAGGDIRSLLKKIHERRPELTLPERWI